MTIPEGVHVGSLPRRDWKSPGLRSRTCAAATYRRDWKAGCRPRIESADHIHRSREAQVAQRRGRQARGVPVCADQDHLPIEIRECRVSMARCRIEAPVEDGPRHMDRTRDGTALVACFHTARINEQGAGELRPVGCLGFEARDPGPCLFKQFGDGPVTVRRVGPAASSFDVISCAW